MDMINLKNALEKIEMPQAMQERIVRNCSEKLHNREERTMKKSNTYRSQKWIPAAFSLSLFLMLSIVGTAAVRTGFFKNITRWDGAVTGGVYEQASEEIEVTAFADGGTLTVSATLLLPGEPPYCFFETFGVQSCQITDGDGKVVMEQKDPVFSRLEDGQASIQIPLEGIKPGDYRLLIRQFAGSAKADQPLTINGIWECHFTLSRL